MRVAKTGGVGRGATVLELYTLGRKKVNVLPCPGMLPR